jgi:ornithine decarboxylase
MTVTLSLTRIRYRWRKDVEQKHLYLQGLSPYVTGVAKAVLLAPAQRALVEPGGFRGSHAMEKLDSAVDLIRTRRPELPVFGLRPHAAGRAARWFLANFPGEVAYAYKANSSVFLIGALYGAGIRQFDVASVPELVDAATIPDARLHFMHPVKSRSAIRRAYFEFGVRCFALDSEDELQKIIDETTGPAGEAKDLELFVRVAVPAKNSRVPLERKFGITGQKAARLLVKARQHCDELGITFHVGSQTTTPDAYISAFEEVRRLIVKAGVVVDAIDVGGGFPSRYSDGEPAPLISYMAAIRAGFDKLPVAEACRLICEPGRALVAEAESLIVRVDARKGDDLYINDGGYGALYDAAHLGFVFPVRLIRPGFDHREPLMPFEMWGPTCDSIDRMRGPFMLPTSIREGDFIEIGNIGAYGKAIAGSFNGYGQYEEVILRDEPMYTMYGDVALPAAQAAR